MCRADYVRVIIHVPSAFQVNVSVKSNSVSWYAFIVAIVPSGFGVPINFVIFFPIGALVNVLRMASWIDSPAQTLNAKSPL